MAIKSRVFVSVIKFPDGKVNIGHIRSKIPRDNEWSIESAKRNGHRDFWLELKVTSDLKVLTELIEVGVERPAAPDWQI